MQAQDFFEQWLAQAQARLREPPYVQPLHRDRPWPTWRASADLCCGDSFDNVPVFAWMALWPLLLIAVVLYFKGEHDQPIRYRVPSPKVPEPKEFLQKPSIKVRVMWSR